MAVFFDSEQMERFQGEFDAEQQAINTLISTDAFQTDHECATAKSAISVLLDSLRMPSSNELDVGDPVDVVEKFCQARENSPEMAATLTALDALWEKDLLSALTLEKWFALQQTEVITREFGGTELAPHLQELRLLSWKTDNVRLAHKHKSFDIANEFLADTGFTPTVPQPEFRQKLTDKVIELCLEESIRHDSQQAYESLNTSETNAEIVEFLTKSGMQAESAEYAVADLRKAAAAKTKPLPQKGDVSLGAA